MLSHPSFSCRRVAPLVMPIGLTTRSGAGEGVS